MTVPTMATLELRPATSPTLNLIGVIVLYSIATALYWTWFRPAERRTLAERRAVS